MDFKCFVLLLCTTFISAKCEVVDNPIVDTKLGKIKGSYMKSRLGKKIYAFRGVRYGKAPIGYRRFKPPEPVVPWRGIFDASEEGPSCIRPDSINPSEDCLALNIYATKLPSQSEKVKRPVMVYLHPGSFLNYSAQSYIYGPQYLLDQDIVLVTVNYRLSALGFLSTGDHRAPGNLGLKDQVVALRFVHRHIASFGGDPHCVTIVGYSAGGWSVILHMLSPMSRGLFQRAIAMSGSPVRAHKLLPRAQKDLTIRQARLLGCDTDNPDRMFECMMKKPAMDFIRTLPQLREFYMDPSTIFYPVVEPNIFGVERFLTAQPMDLIRSRNFHHVPLIIGLTRDESVKPAFQGIEDAKKGNDSYFQDLNREWDRVAPICFMYDNDTQRSKIATKEIRKFYLNDEPISLRNAKILGQIYADSIVGFPVDSAATLMATYNREPTRYYAFVYQGRYSHNMYSDTKKPYGVVHMDDLMYLFHISYKFPFFDKDAPEVPVIEKMTAMWANFARTGEPTPKNDKIFDNVNWEVLTPSNRKYLEINDKLVMKTDWHENYEFWYKLFPLPPTHHPSTPHVPRVPHLPHVPVNSLSPLISHIIHSVLDNI